MTGSARRPPAHHCALIILAFLMSLGCRIASAGDASFGKAELERLLQASPVTGHPVDSISELIPLLPAELRRNFTFVYDSRSPFRSSISPDYPRVILFTDDARLVLTFIGDEQKPGADLLEILSFDDRAAGFEPKSYLLPVAQRRNEQLSPAATNCGQCHGADPRPIFDSYPLWPGFYGSVYDTFSRDRLGVVEEKRYRHFLATSAQAGVYRDLMFSKGSPVSPYLDPRRLANGTLRIDYRTMTFLPNARLGMALTELNRKRIYRKLAAGANFAAREKQLLAELLECKGAADPAPEAQQLIQANLKQENTGRLERLGLRPRDERPDRENMQELEFIREIAEIDRVAGEAGSDRSDWSMALEPGSLAFFDGILSGMYRGKSYYLKEDLIYEFLSHLGERDPAFRRYFVVINAFGDDYPFGHRISLGDARQSCRLLKSEYAR
jgi:hypothetical protein